MEPSGGARVVRGLVLDGRQPMDSGHPPRVRWGDNDDVRTIGGRSEAATKASAPAEAAAEAGGSLFRNPPIALRPLAFSQKGQEWRPYPRSHCPECNAAGRCGARSWYASGDAQCSAPAPSRPDGAFGKACECRSEAEEVLSCEFRAAGEGNPVHLQELDCKLLDGVLRLLCVGADSAGAAARGLRALAASCRRGRELVAAARWVPGLRCELFPHQVAALQRATQLESRRKLGRVCGGVMCDEAGLGKTITALALIARSRWPAVPRIPIDAQLQDDGYYLLAAHTLNSSTTKCNERRKLLMAGRDERAARDNSRFHPARKRFDTARDPQAGFGGGVFTADRRPERIGPVCRCTLIVVPEELEQQWQNELSSKSTLRHRIVLRKSHIRSLKNHGLLNKDVVAAFPQPYEIESGQLDCVITTFDRIGSRKGKRDGGSQQDRMLCMRDGLALIHWQRIIIDEGHELGGRGIGDMAVVLGAVLASATWVMSGTPDR